MRLSIVSIQERDLSTRQYLMNYYRAKGKWKKVIDLGQSCPIGTVKPRIQGTPDYIAPEQVHRRPITPLTDVYNFGATMYWVLTRQHVPTALAKGDSLMGSLDDNLIAKPARTIEQDRRSNRNHGRVQDRSGGRGSSGCHGQAGLSRP